MTRLVNPLADRTKLRYPPILMEHGGTIDTSVYLMASSIQHMPELWPRGPEDGPIKSSNRSLAFMLANNGFDVFLCETRGSSDNNNRHIGYKAIESSLDGTNKGKNRTFMENLDEATRQWDYWSFTQDDIIAHELKSHMDCVMNVTGAEQVSVFSFSLSTPTCFAFFSIRPDYAKKVHGFVSMAPIISSAEGTNKLIKLAVARICPLIPDSAGTLVATDILLTPLSRDISVTLARNKELRYSLFKMVVILALGTSAQYRTNLELNVLGHLLRRLSFRYAKQLCQQVSSKRLQKYDYGPIKNKELYGAEKPPIYDLSDLRIKDWLLVSAWNDAIATPKVVEHLLKIVRPKPMAHVVTPYGHLDLVAAFDNDKYTNMPILNYMKRMSYDPSETSTRKAANYNLGQLFAPLQLLNSDTQTFGSGNRSDYEPADGYKGDYLAFPPPVKLMARSFQRSMRGVLDGLQDAVGDPKVGVPERVHGKMNSTKAASLASDSNSTK